MEGTGKKLNDFTLCGLSTVNRDMKAPNDIALLLIKHITYGIGSVGSIFWVGEMRQSQAKRVELNRSAMALWFWPILP